MKLHFGSISGNNITNNVDGIYMENSSDNTVSGNNITNGGDGILLWNSSNNTVSENDITNHYDEGIHMTDSSNNTVSGNNITNNDWGINLYQSSNNTFYHNNFMNYVQQVYIESAGFGHFWDDGYPSGGNYWSDHVCTGNPSDGSQPYIIDDNNIDHYPFQNPNGWLLHQLTVTSSPITGITFTIDGTLKTTPSTEWLPEGSYTLIMQETHNGYVWSHWLEDGDTNRTKTVTMDINVTLTGIFYHFCDLNNDRLVDIDDLMVAALAFGGYPGHPRWNPIADLTKDEIVDIDDIVIIAVHFGEYI